MIAVTIRGHLLRKGRLLWHLDCDIGADGLRLVGLDYYQLEEELASRLRAEIGGVGEPGIDVVPFVLRMPLYPAGLPDVEWDPSWERCEACELPLGPAQHRWCSRHALRCEHCGQFAADVHEECAEHREAA